MAGFLKRLERSLRKGRTADPAGLPWPEAQAIDGVALVTMSKNEDDMLAHWLSHYMRLLPDPRFFILDDASDSPPAAQVVAQVGAEDRTDILHLPAGGFSDRYKATALSALSAMLLDRFAVVIATDADEVIAPFGGARGQDLNTILQALPGPFSAPIGVLPVHETGTEGPFDPLRPLAEQRRFGFLHASSTKPAIWKGRPAVFTPGQHALQDRAVPLAEHLVLLHLRYVDHAATLARQEGRNAVTFSAAQPDTQAKRWRVPPDQMDQNPFVAPFEGLEDAPTITDALPGFLDTHTRQTGAGRVLKDRAGVAPVRLEGCL